LCITQLYRLESNKEEEEVRDVKVHGEVPLTGSVPGFEHRVSGFGIRESGSVLAAVDHTVNHKVKLTLRPL
jgi:hypothetical protein